VVRARAADVVPVNAKKEFGSRNPRFTRLFGVKVLIQVSQPIFSMD
jgi:hypothetical protein